MKKDFVTFYSPGTFVAEMTTKQVPSWSIPKALKLMTDVKERHGAVPYGFRFTTKKRGLRDFEPKEVARSGMYYVNCRVETLDELTKRCDPTESTLLENMKRNGWDRIVTSKTGWKWTQPLHEGDTVL